MTGFPDVMEIDFPNGFSLEHTELLTVLTVLSSSTDGNERCEWIYGWDSINTILPPAVDYLK